MGNVADRITQARLEITRAAIQRWQLYSDRRQKSRLLIEREGPGAASSQKQRAEWSARETRRQAIGLQGRPGLEQMIGRTWDASIFAPSEQARNIARPVARIVTMPGTGYEPQGVATGFLVTSRLLLTNHHVIPEKSYAVGCGANFLHVRDERGEQEGIFFEFDPDAFYMADKNLDFALVGICPLGTKGEKIEELGTIRLIEATGKTLIGYPINIIQHPNGGPRQYATKNNRLLDILDEGFLHYETDTAHGSSGSPVFSGKWELVALHHCGIPELSGSDILKRDGSIWNPESDSEEDIQWIANEGTRVNSIVSRLKQEQPASSQERRFLDELLKSTADPLNPNIFVPVTLPAGLSLTEGSTMPQHVFNISGNVTINMYDGARETSSVDKISQLNDRSAPDVSIEEKAQNFDPNYTSRAGFNEMFLGVEIPLPTVSNARLAELYTVGDYRQFFAENRAVPEIDLAGVDDNDPLVIPYHHYSLVMNKAYRMVMWTASNADYRNEMRQDKRPRKQFGDESWRPDPRVPRELQLLDSDIYEPAKNFDRGHIVRREDNCWGAPGLETEYTNSDTYHWTNCTPQHELFNQESPKGDEYRGRKGVWGFFEDELADQIEKGGGQATLFAGPVLNEDCPSKDFGRGAVKYPLKFWKVVVVPESNARKPKLLVYGFVFDQTKPIDEFGVGFKESIDLQKDFGRQAKSLQEIMELTGIEFADVLLAADQHAR